MTWYVATNQGFLGERKPVVNVHHAQTFETFADAKGFADYIGLKFFVILKECEMEITT